MTNENESLFKQAINEALNHKIQSEIEACEEIVCSRRHYRIMRAIIRGKNPKENRATPAKRKLIAILVAAAVLLLAGCAIIYRDEIRSFVANVKEFFVELSFSEGEDESRSIEDVYELTYVPEGYTLKSQNIARMRVQYVFENADGSKIKFMQQPLDTSSFTVDSEHSDNILIELGNYTIYVRKTNDTYYYLWNDGKYALQLYSTENLSNQGIKLIIDGIAQK